MVTPVVPELGKEHSVMRNAVPALATVDNVVEPALLAGEG
jgi:hypothetical protein